MIDKIDRQILMILQESSRTSNAEIARQVGMAASGVHERIRKLEEKGILRAYETRVDPKAVGQGLLAFVMVRSSEKIGDESTGQALARMPEVQEVHHIAGEDCYQVKVRCADTETLGKLLREGFGSISTVTSTRTTIALETLKESGRIPIPGAEPPADSSSGKAASRRKS